MTALRAVPELDDQALDRLADRIADRLAVRAAGELIDPAELARRIGRSRAFLYEHADVLGAIRLGGGPRPRLAFRWPHALDRLTNTESAPPSAHARARTARRTAPTSELLPIRGSR